MQITEILYTQAREKQYKVRNDRPESSPRKCAYPSCPEKAGWDSFCWFHYQEEHYALYMDNYMIPYIGDKELGEITVEDIQHLFDTLAKPDPERNRKALAHKSIERVCGLGRRLYRIATEMKLCEDTPFKMALLTIEGEESHHHKALPDEVVDRVKKAIPDLADPRERLYMGLLAYTGMRVEEIVGLRWENVFLDRHYGEVRRVVIYPDRKNPLVREKTKTKHSTRDFIIPDALKEILEPLRLESGFYYPRTSSG